MASLVANLIPAPTFAAPAIDPWPKAGERSWPNGQLIPEPVSLDRATLEALYQQSPEAALLVLQSQHLRLQRQHGAIERAFAAYEASGAAGPSGERPSVIKGAIEQAVKLHETKIVKPAATATSAYTKYVTALSQMLTELQGMPTAESNGNSNMQGQKMLARIAKFIAEWYGKPAATLGTFDSEQAAQELASQFKAGTVKTIKVGGGKINGVDMPELHMVVISIEPLNEILKAIADNDEHAAHMTSVITDMVKGGSAARLDADDLLKRLGTVIVPRDPDLENDWRAVKKEPSVSHMSESQLRDFLRNLKWSAARGWIGDFLAYKYSKLINKLWDDPNYFNEIRTTVTTRQGGVSPQIMQTFSIAADDVRKTHDTDANLLMDHYRRSLGEYNSRLKMVSSMISALGETYRMALP